MFIRIFARKQKQITVIGVQRIFFRVNQSLAGFFSYLKIALILSATMKLIPGTDIKRHTGKHGLSGSFSQTSYICRQLTFQWNMCFGKLQVFYDACNHLLFGYTRSHQLFRVHIECTQYVWNISKSLHQIEIEICPEKTGFTCITVLCGLTHLSFLIILQKIISMSYLFIGCGPYPISIAWSVCSGTYQVSYIGKTVGTLIIQRIRTVHILVKHVRCQS